MRANSSAEVLFQQKERTKIISPVAGNIAAMSQAQVSVSADDWFSIKEKLKSEALTTKIIIGLREDGTKRKMNVSFVLLMAMCNIPGGSFEEQDFTDLNMEKLSPDEQRTLAELVWNGQRTLDGSTAYSLW